MCVYLCVCVCYSVNHYLSMYLSTIFLSLSLSLSLSIYLNIYIYIYIYVHNLRSLRTSNVDRSNERKYLYTKKRARSRRYPGTNYYRCRPWRWQTESLQHSLELVASGIGLYLNEDKKEYTCFNKKKGDIPLNGGSLKLVNKQHPIYWKWNNIWQVKTWIAIDRVIDHKEVRLIR